MVQSQGSNKPLTSYIKLPYEDKIACQSTFVMDLCCAEVILAGIWTFNVMISTCPMAPLEDCRYGA